MASKTQAFILLFSLFSVSFIINSSQAATGQLAVYWGQDGRETTLQETCASGYYDIVLLAFLNVFGAGRTPGWNFAGHCGDWSPCTKLAPEIQYCQSRGIKVFLALGGAIGDYSIASAEDAKVVAKYLWDNFLTGAQSGPLGTVALDGIDFDIEGGSNLHWDDLANELNALKQQRKFYLSAAPQCPIPDYYLDAAIKTGHFDYIFVQFYNNPPCQYSDGNPENLFRSWDAWNSLVLSNNSVFLGLPAARGAAPSGGYIEPGDLIQTVLPYVKQSPKYGGVMLWSRYWDIQSTPPYSAQIRPYVINSVLQSATAIADAIFECVSKTMYRLFPKSLAE